jgi:hypothetical protein
VWVCCRELRVSDGAHAVRCIDLGHAFLDEHTGSAS